MKVCLLVAARLCTLLASFTAAAASPYAGQESRDIKALASEDVEAYLSGKGMGFARAAELNGYPGPAHVLELGAKLELTPEQRRRTESLFASMQARAIRLGRTLVDEERKLDRLFAGRTVTPSSLAAASKRIGALQGRIRAVHLDAHLAQMRILSPAQIARYGELRGYAASTSKAPAHGRHRH